MIFRSRMALPLAATLLVVGCGGKGTNRSARSVRYEPLQVGSGNSVPVTVSGNGTVVGGYREFGPYLNATIWRKTDAGEPFLDTPNPRMAFIQAMSTDGSKVLGMSEANDGTRLPAFGSAQKGVVVLPLPPGKTAAYPIDISGDGTVAVCLNGSPSGPATTPVRPYIVKGGVATYLPLPSVTSTAGASAVSADGRVVVGNVAGNPVRWVDGGEPEILDDVAGGALDANRDGSVVVGLFRPEPGVTVPFRWSPATGLQQLPVVPSFRDGIARSVSRDGRTVLITAFDVAENRERVFLWREGMGTQPLDQIVGQESTDVVFDGSIAIAMSGDGMVIIGRGVNRSSGALYVPWRLVLP